MKMETKFKIITLNCWGIVGMSKHRSERFSAIANYLGTSDYDFVFLQEVWNMSDFDTIVRKTTPVLPYSHYFHSGVFGSGVCILSKAPFVDVALHKFSLNGFVHKVHHGDWFGGKAVGLCRVFYKGLNISLFVSHHHAEYNRVQDQYLAHRIAQAFEMSQFVRLTSESSDLTILAGDFNTEPNDVAYRIIVQNTGCVDAFLEKPPTLQDSDPTYGMTCGNPRNCYTTASELKEAPNGKRIDFIMYKTNSGTSAKCLSLDMPINRIPGHDEKKCYSDHEALDANLAVFKSADVRGSVNSVRARIAALEDGQEIIQASLKALQGDRLFYILLVVVLVCLMILTFPLGTVLGSFFGILIYVRVLLFAALFLAFWVAVVVYRTERSSTLAAQCNMQVLLDALRSQDDAQTKRDTNRAFHAAVFSTGKSDNSS